jgi:rubrerythrin
VALSALSVALMPMMESSGTTLARRLPPTALVERHTELGESLLGWVVGLFVVVLAIVAVDSWARRARKTAGPGAQRELGSGARGGVIRHSLALLAIVIAAATIVQTVRVGHSGAHATWSRDPAAARLFTEIAADEAEHLRRFTTALAASTQPESGAQIPPGPIGTPVPIPAGPATSPGQTLSNLRAAMRGEAFASGKYTLYAEQARRDGNPALAELFTDTAKVELGEHYAAEARLAGLVGDTNTNLADAIAGESYEADTMYPDYARQARQYADTQAAELFGDIAADENPSANL